MTENATTIRRFGTERQRYAGLWAFAGVAYGALVAAGYPLAAVGAFAAGGLLATVVRYRASAPLFDERDEHLSRVAAARTVRTVGAASAVFFPVAVVLWALGYHEWPPWLAYLGVYVAALFALYGVVSLLTRAESRTR